MHAIKELFMLAAEEVFYTTEKIVFLSTPDAVKFLFIIFVISFSKCSLTVQETSGQPFPLYSEGKIVGEVAV
jgi:hypothetical protein